MKKHTPGRGHRKYTVEMPFIRIENPMEEIWQRMIDNSIERSEEFGMTQAEEWGEL
ncbi:MAG: hypothetical protein HFE78_05165 [Clostridiales bacterium]|nr:hypothetical protein [Clostridiales bacterium]